jgi:sortase A
MNTRMQNILSWSERLFWAAALAIAAFLGFAFLQARLYQNAADRYLDQFQRAAPPVAGAAPPEATIITPAPADGDILGRIELPRLHLSAPILEGASPGILRRGVGHIRGTAVPGTPGNSAIAGHRDIYFRALKDVRIHDEIHITTPASRQRYQVEWMKIVAPGDLSVLKPSDDSGLTLVTCYPFYYIGHAPKRFVVRARRLNDSPPSTREMD